ncbi:MAG: hypothetical protein C7B45_01940 [Sulfobacillus acidophilus]|uniref:Uncharacterized protein n=1 Tax=Sulfobacillus acidophilus TaxID=53633 RepID=A0A2T2WNI6_9FIRM|nr:MAG: hypothetical protein C7B45_01940 [Sulfobacillus acidophilus]
MLTPTPTVNLLHHLVLGRQQLCFGHSLEASITCHRASLALFAPKTPQMADLSDQAERHRDDRGDKSLPQNPAGFGPLTTQ